MSGMCLLGIQYRSVIPFIHGFVHVGLALKELRGRISKWCAFETQEVQSENHRFGRNVLQNQ